MIPISKDLIEELIQEAKDAKAPQERLSELESYLEKIESLEQQDAVSGNLYLLSGEMYQATALDDGTEIIRVSDAPIFTVSDAPILGSERNIEKNTEFKPVKPRHPRYTPLSSILLKLGFLN